MKLQNSKPAALHIIERLPDDASTEQIMYELFFRERVERGMRQLDNKKTVSHQEVRRSVARWLRSSGR